jgi:hypothetical protein
MTFAREVSVTAKVRRVGLFEARDSYGGLKPLQDGELRPNIVESVTWDDPINELVNLGTVEEWDIFNFSTRAVSRLCARWWSGVQFCWRSHIFGISHPLVLWLVWFIVCFFSPHFSSCNIQSTYVSFTLKWYDGI